MIKNKTFLISYKLLFGLLGFSAVVTEISTIAERGAFNASNFFSFFTVENNILIFLTLLISALYVAAGRTPRWFDKLRGATTVYIAIVGIGFAALLSGVENTVLTAVPWDNTVLHYIVPIAAFIDFLIDRPKTKLGFRPSLVWLLFPIGYVIYSLIRGTVVGWYPYPFLDPNHKGFSGIAVALIGLLLVATVLTWVVCKLSGDRAQSAKN